MLIILVSGTFVVQSQYYSSQSLRVGAHDNARVATERVASEIRSTMEAGFVVAGPRTLTVRSPLALAVVCDRTGTDARVHLEGGAAGLATDEFAGLALRNPATGAWQYQNLSWGSVNGGSVGAASACAANGADTTGASSEFHTLLGAGPMFTPAANEGDILMLFRETTFKVQASVLNTQTLGLFRQAYGESLVEFATGMDSTAQFMYRTGGSTYADTVSGSNLVNIDAVRIVADARLPARSGAMDDVTFGWSVNVAVRNAP